MTKRTSPLDKAMQQKILRLYHEGLTLSTLAARFKSITSIETIRKLIKENEKVKP